MPERISLIFHTLTRPQITDKGIWNGKTIAIDLEKEGVRLSEENPFYLQELAKGQFFMIEASLAEKGIFIPDNWTLADMFTFLAISQAMVLNKQLPIKRVGKPPLGYPESFEDPIFIELILEKNRYFPESKKYQTIGFRIRMPRKTFEGTILTPDQISEHEFNPKISGLPEYIKVAQGKKTITGAVGYLQDYEHNASELRFLTNNCDRNYWETPKLLTTPLYADMIDYLAEFIKRTQS
ncbi:hypothetical protein GYA19_03975 [Candidatus Beckwithbacteria bacterium]|nr:hypothetical protein [Candidatus Beckwithbacteria bacterium]